jgi:8-oxo-dGTP diphosphatase
MPDDPDRRSQAVSAAGALFFDASDRVMLVRPTYKPGWDIPGGYVERAETPLVACRREVREELGIAPTIGRLLVVDWAPQPTDGDKVLFVFDGGVLDLADQAAIDLDPKEIAEYAFHAASQVPALLVPRLARRALSAIRARREGLTLYLEHGREPGDDQR